VCATHSTSYGARGSAGGSGCWTPKSRGLAILFRSKLGVGKACGVIRGPISRPYEPVGKTGPGMVFTPAAFGNRIRPLLAPRAALGRFSGRHSHFLDRALGPAFFFPSLGPPPLKNLFWRPGRAGFESTITFLAACIGGCHISAIFVVRRSWSAQHQTWAFDGAGPRGNFPAEIRRVGQSMVDRWSCGAGRRAIHVFGPLPRRNFRIY